MAKKKTKKKLFCFALFCFFGCVWCFFFGGLCVCVFFFFGGEVGGGGCVCMFGVGVGVCEFGWGRLGCVCVWFLLTLRVHCIERRLKFYAETSHTRRLLHLAHISRPTSLDWNQGKCSATNIGQITIQLFILETWKRSRDGGVIGDRYTGVIFNAKFTSSKLCIES